MPFPRRVGALTGPGRGGRFQRHLPALLLTALTALTGAGMASTALPGAPLASTVAGVSQVSGPAAPADTLKETVILLHGLGRTHRSMSRMERSLEEAGYRVVNLGYPSRHHPVGVLVDSLAAELAACCSDSPSPLHFVTHSLGGILVRAYQAGHGADRIGRVVMLSPPNHGSEIVDRVPERLLELVVGPAALQLGTDSTSVLTRLPPVEFDLGIITGDATMNPLFSWWLPGEDDGKVSVESARLEGADDFLVLPYSHTWIMQREQVIEQVLSFLGHGRFAEAPRPALR